MTTAPFGEIAEIDRLIHEPARLAIATALLACQRADFRYLQHLTGLTKGNLSSHLGRLESAGVIEISKVFEDRRPMTWVSLTPAGRRLVEDHWERLAALSARVRRGFDPTPEPPPATA